ncbi:hypothetical protein VP01_11192g1, partial [Puccinia sorghi]
WQLQVNFESQKHTDNEIQEKLAHFFERKELLKDTIYLFVVATSTESTQLYSTSILQKIEKIQIAQSTEAAEISGEFSDLNPGNSMYIQIQYITPSFRTHSSYSSG